MFGSLHTFAYSLHPLLREADGAMKPREQTTVVDIQGKHLGAVESRQSSISGRRGSPRGR